MTKKADFAAEESNELRAVPAVVSSAYPSGLFGALKAAAGGTRGMIESLKAAQSVELAAELLADRSFPGLPDPKELSGEGSRSEQMANLRRNAIAKGPAACSAVRPAVCPAACRSRAVPAAACSTGSARSPDRCWAVAVARAAGCPSTC